MAGHGSREYFRKLNLSSKKQLADGMPPVVLVLAAIVIADGEELRTSKAMCKLPRPGHYTVINT